MLFANLHTSLRLKHNFYVLFQPESYISCIFVYIYMYVYTMYVKQYSTFSFTTINFSFKALFFYREKTVKSNRGDSKDNRNEWKGLKPQKHKNFLFEERL